MYNDLLVHTVANLKWLAHEEECGLLFWDSVLKQIVLSPMDNTHWDPKYHFAIDARDAEVLIEATGRSFIGVFHTHIEADNPDPSDDDLKELARMKRVRGYGRCYGIVYHVPSRTLTTYTERGVVYRTRMA